MKTEPLDSPQLPELLSASSSVTHKSVMTYLHQISGQEKHVEVVDVDHTYAKPWNKHPDPQIRARPAKFLFMKDFPRHFIDKSITGPETIDVVSVDQKPIPPFSLSSTGVDTFKTTSRLTESDNINELPPPPKTGWNTQMNKLWTKAMKILHSDRLARIAYEGQANEAILRKNLIDRSANKFRHLFSSVSYWDLNLLMWLHKTLTDYVGPHFIIAYHDAMHVLRLKIPNLIDKFYMPPKSETSSRMKQQTIDPIQTMLNNYKPKRINGSPLFLIVPNGPQIPHQMTSQRMKHWHNLFGSLGKVITISVMSRAHETSHHCLSEIRYAVRDKIKECKTTFNEGRPLVLVGFGHSSLIAAHCALENAAFVNATICLGFPLTAINGFRGDLDDPLLETTVPTLFIVGQNSSMATLDDIEDFRERITKTETGLVVVGGANNRLIVSSSKKKFEGITQSIVDRCIADEICEFVSNVLNPSNYDHFYAPGLSTSRSGYSGPMSGRSPLGTPVKPKRKRPQKDKEKSNSKSKKPKIQKVQSSVAPETNAPAHASDQLLNKNPTEKIGSTEPISTAENKPKEENRAENQTNLDTVKSEKLSHPIETEATNVQNSTNEAHEMQTPSKIDRHQGFCYGISELPTVVSQSATRAGRQIRAPKSLDV